MDLSKLPGNAPPSPPAPAAHPVAPPPGAAPALDYGRTAGDPLWLSGPEAFVDLAVALIVLYIARGVFSHGSVTNESGLPISYFQSWFFIGDLPLVMLAGAFGIDILCRAVIRTPAAARLAAFALAFAALANLGAVLYLLPKLGLQLFNAIAVAAAGYSAWIIFDKLRGAPLPRN